MKIQFNNHSFVRPVGLMFLSTGITHIQLLISQSLSAMISLEYLNAFSMLCYLLIFCQVLGFALGETCYVLVNKDLRIHKLRQYLGGAVFFYLIISIAFILSIVFFNKYLIEFLALESVPQINLNLYIWTAITVTYGFVSILLYMMPLVYNQMRLVKNGLVILTSNLIFIAASFWLFSDAETRFRLIGLSFLASWLLSLLILLIQFKGKIKISFSNLIAFYKRARHMIFGEALICGSDFVGPLFLSIAIFKTIGAEGLAAYNVGFRILEVFLSLQWSICFYGVGILSEILQFRGEPEWYLTLQKLTKAAVLFVGVPIVATVCLLPVILRLGFNLQSNQATIIAGATLLAYIPTIVTTGVQCKIRVFEKQLTRAVMSSSLVMGLGLISIYLLGKHSLVFGVAVCGLMLPSILEAAWLHRYNLTALSDRDWLNSRRS